MEKNDKTVAVLFRDADGTSSSGRGEWQAKLDNLQLEGVTLLNMATESVLGTKLRLEMEDTEGKYLLYFPSPEPEVEKDWLLDIKLYSRYFYADRLLIILNDLGLFQQSLREHLARSEKFLSSKARLSALHRKADNLGLTFIL